jgi:hypothetical protein
MNKMSFLLRLLFVCTFLFATISMGLAQEVEKSSSKWHYVAEPYMFFANMSGETTLAQFPEISVDAPASDVLGHLKMGALLYAEATNNDWSITSDYIYMKLGQDAETSRLIKSGSVTMKETVWELAGFKRITPWLEGGAGCRLVSLNLGLDVETISESHDVSTDEMWVDPIIALRSNHTFNNKWLVQLRGDVGGFGVGSDFSWQAQANVGYKFSKLFQTSVGYRYVGMDYDKGDGSERFLYDMDTYGAVVRLGFNF